MLTSFAGKSRVRNAVFAAACSATLLAAASASAADPVAEWPGWLGPQRDGRSPDKGLLKSWPEGGPALLWKAEGVGQGYSSPAVGGGTIYITGDAGDQLAVFALGLDGKEKWKADFAPKYTGQWPGARATPTLDGGKLYLVSGQGIVGCLEADTGKKVWTRDFREMGGKVPQWGYAESVLILDDLAIVTPGGNNAVAALDKSTGETVWASDAQAAAHYGSCIAIREKGSTAIVAGTGSGILAVDAKTGKKLWSNEFCKGNTANCPTPAYADGYLFWANGYDKGGICFRVGFANGAWTFQEAWTTKDMVCHHGGYVILDGFLYGNHSSKRLGHWACIELKTGRTRWIEPGVGKGSLCFADGMFYLFGEKNGLAGLAAASPEGMRMAGTFSVSGSGPSWAHPVVIGGRLYLRYDTTLYCFDVKAK